ncbi:MAG: DUF2269 family protein, partial [Gaiellaceae bacterium]
MAGPYLIGVDGGTQSSKVVVYDATGNVASEGRRSLRPMSRPRHGVAVHPDDDLWESIAAASRLALDRFRGDPREIAGVARTVVLADFLFTAGAVVVQPLTGFWLAWSSGYSLWDGWIALSIALYLVTGAFWLPVVWMQM